MKTKNIKLNSLHDEITKNTNDNSSGNESAEPPTETVNMIKTPMGTVQVMKTPVGTVQVMKTQKHQWEQFR